MVLLLRGRVEYLIDLEHVNAITEAYKILETLR